MQFYQLQASRFAKDGETLKTLDKEELLDSALVSSQLYCACVMQIFCRKTNAKIQKTPYIRASNCFVSKFHAEFLAR